MVEQSVARKAAWKVYNLDSQTVESLVYMMADLLVVMLVKCWAECSAGLMVDLKVLLKGKMRVLRKVDE